MLTTAIANKNLASSNEVTAAASGAALLGVKAILFNGFGTLVRVALDRRVYKVVFSGVGDKPAAERVALTEPLELKALMLKLLPNFPASSLMSFRAALEEELDSVELFPEVLKVLAALRARGIKIAVGSNLALPYVNPLKRLLEAHVDTWILSCHEGVAKPELAFYEKAVQALGCEPAEVLMVGDSLECDYEAPLKAGLKARHLVRKPSAAHFLMNNGRSDIVSLKELLG